eukprot:XP_028333843.1 uncharacterized protein LOC114484039 [Physeter catodon]
MATARVLLQSIWDTIFKVSARIAEERERRNTFEHVFALQRIQCRAAAKEALRELARIYRDQIDRLLILSLGSEGVSAIMEQPELRAQLLRMHQSMVDVEQQQLRLQEVLASAAEAAPTGKVQHSDEEGSEETVIPIPPNASVDRYRKLFLSIDGLLLPGGSAAIHSQAAPYYRATKLFLDWAVEANKSGRYFPVLGICLGFQAMVIWGGGDNFWYFTADDPRNVDRTRQLQFLPAAKTSKLFGPDRSTTAFFPASTEYENGSVRGDETHRASLLNFDASLEQESRSARRGGVPQYAQRWQHVEEAQENQPRTFKDNAEAAMGNVIDKTMLVDLLSREETAYFHHAHRITRAEFDRDAILSQRFALLATVMVPKSGGSEESDADDEFVAIVESTQFPFYGFQFHPEKSLFEHNPFSDVRHDAGSRWVANSLALFFSNEVGKSTRKSTPFAEEWAHLIQRYTPTDFSSPSAPYAFEEVYFFRNNVESALVHTIE